MGTAPTFGSEERRAEEAYSRVHGLALVMLNGPNGPSLLSRLLLPILYRRPLRKGKLRVLLTSPNFQRVYRVRVALVLRQSLPVPNPVEI